jgi:integrase
MRAAGQSTDGARLRALIIILWRAGLRIGEALDLAETDLDPTRGAVLVRKGKGGRRREVGMDRWAWSQLEPWIDVGSQLPVGVLLCVIHGATAGRHWEQSAARKQLRPTAASAGVRRRLAPAPAPPRARGRDGA